MKELIIDITPAGSIMNRRDLIKMLNDLKPGKHLITMKDMRRRSLPQNAYYWAVVVPLVRRGLYDIGFDEVQTNEDAHELLKRQFIRRQFANKQTGEMVTVTGSTARLTTSEFGEYIERVCQWAAEYLNVVIPSPNEQMATFSEWEQSMTE